MMIALPSMEALRRQAIALLLRHAPADGLHGCAVPGLQLIRASAPAQPLPALYEPGLVLVLQGRKQATLGTEVLHYDPLHCLLVAMTLLPVGQVTEATPERPYLCLRLLCSPQMLADLLIEVGPGTSNPDKAADATRGLNLAPVSAELLDAALRLLRLLEAPQDVAVLAPMLRREVFYRVLTGPLGPRLRALAQEHSRGRRVGRAIELLQAQWDQPLRIDDLAAAAHMSPSSLHLHFKQLTALSPLQYQKHLRLQRARQLMLSEGLDAASAAHRVGYESPSQFSREYRRLFGAPPRTEVQQLG
jgi:AraC-like DNA-binding protein